MSLTPPAGTVTLAAGTYVDAKFSADGLSLYAVSADTILVIDVATGAVVDDYTFGVAVGAIDISPDGNFLAFVLRQPAGTTGAAYRLSRLERRCSRRSDCRFRPIQ